MENATTWWLIRLTPARALMLTQGPTPEESAAIAAHFQYLKRACDEGRVVLFGRTAGNDEHVVGLCLLRAPDEATARALMQADPAVLAGVMHARLDSYRLAGFNGQGVGRI